MARKILLADDSVTAQNMGRKILADAGYEVITVNNGSAALKKIAETKPDLIVLDVYMPGYSGLEVCQRVKEVNETARIPILLTVGKLEPFKPEEAKRVRAEGFIVKPFEASELLSALAKLEDKIVPRADSSKPGRFARAIAAVEEGRYDKAVSIDEDSGWKSRISFPTKKKQKAVEPEDGDDPAIYNAVNKDLKTVVEHKPAHAPHPAQHEPAANHSAPHHPIASSDGLVDMGALVAHGLPTDVTPEEIAALAAAAAQVQGITEIKNSESVPPPQEISKEAIHKPEEVSPRQSETAAPIAEIRAEATIAEVKAAEEKTVEAATAEVKIAETKIEDGGALQQETQKHETTEADGRVAAWVETNLLDAPKSEPKEAVSEPAASTEKTANEVAAEDSWATFASENLDQEKLREEKFDRKELGQKEEAQSRTGTREVAREDLGAGIAADAWPAIASFATAADLPSSSENVISALEALKLAEPEPIPVAAAPTHADAVSRWTAVAVALAPEEATISLEEEMRKVQASALPAAISPEPTPGPVLVESRPADKPAETTGELPVAEALAVTPAPISARPAEPAPEVAEAAIARFESTSAESASAEPARSDLASTDLANSNLTRDGARVVAESATPIVKEFETVTSREPEPSPALAEAPSEPPSPAEPVSAAVAELLAAVSPVEDISAANTKTSDEVAISASPESAVEAVSSPTIEQASVSAAEPALPLESVAEAVAAAQEAGIPAQATGPETTTAEVAPLIALSAAPESLISQQSVRQESMSREGVESAQIKATEQTSGGPSDMAKKESEIASTTAAAWASWRRIRQTDHKSATPEKESAAENVSDEAESPREEAAMAVAAGAEKAPEEVAADSESPEIASIVDSVLADLRPKIVEEISRKLGKKKKK